jgi:hypothetical protein
VSESRADDERLVTMLQQSFASMGASPEQSRVMAIQLLKRARQVATSEGIPESAAMAGLLAKVVSGRRGDYTGQPPGPDRE